MHLLRIADLTKEEIDGLLEGLGSEGEHKKGIRIIRSGKTLGLIFGSLPRARASRSRPPYHLGGNAIFISGKDSQINRGEPIKDTARVMSRYVDAIVIRTFGHEIIEEYANYSSRPVINGLTTRTTRARCSPT